MVRENLPPIPDDAYTSRGPIIVDKDPWWGRMLERSFKNGVIVNIIFTCLHILTIYLMLSLNQKIELDNAVSSKPYRIDVNDVRIRDKKKMYDLLEVLTKAKVELVDPNLYAYDKPEELKAMEGEVAKLREIRKQLVTDLKKKVSKKEKPKPTKRLRVEPPKDNGELTDQDYEEIRDLIERLDDAYYENK